MSAWDSAVQRVVQEANHLRSIAPWCKGASATMPRLGSSCQSQHCRVGGAGDGERK